MAQSPEKTIYFPVEIAQRFIVDVFTAMGTPAEDAGICGQVLIASDLFGIDSHGIGRLKYYYDRIKAGQHFTTTRWKIVKETETTALIDGHHGMGHVIAFHSMKLAIEKARRYGLGAVAVRNGTHFGIAGFYPLMAVQEGMIGLTVTNARPAIAPTFGTEPMLGTNPIAFAAPTDLPYPFLFDAATSITQRGKIEVLERAEQPAPEGWAINELGEPATDPNDMLRSFDKFAAALLPLGGAGELMGGHKGYGLATMVEILSASLQEGMHGKDLLGYAPDGSRRPFMLGHFFLAIDIEHFIPLAVSRRITGEILRNLQASRKAPGEEKIFVAGEKEFEMEKARRGSGIPVNRNLQRELRIMRDELGIAGYNTYF